MSKNSFRISERLISKIALQDKKAFETLYIKTHVSVYGFALSIIKDKHLAEDITQDVYIKVFNNAHKYKSKGKPMAWIFTITKNLCLDEFRRKKNQDIKNDQLAREAIKIIDESKAMENNLLIDKLINTLDIEEREIVTLHTLSGFKYKEIADFLNKPLSTVISKHYRAIKKLKREVDGENKKS